MTEREASRVEQSSLEQLALDEFFEQAIEALERGSRVPFDAFMHAHPSLARQAEQLADLARSICGGESSLPEIPGYTVLTELGRGAMGVVYLARQESLGGRTVAIKVLPQYIASSLSARARFKAEVLSASRQRHAGIVGVFDFIESDNLLALVMEWVEGASLQQITARLVAMDAYRPQPAVSQVAEALDSASLADPDFEHFIARVGAVVAVALAEVHGSGILHRDVTPSNILVRRDGQALLSDFGLAKGEHSAGMTTVPGFLGTLGYASPEQLAGSPIDNRSDVYSLGCTLLHMVTGSPPHQETSPVGAIEAVRRGEPLRRLSEARAIEPTLRAIIARAAAIDPADRYQNATALAEDLKVFLSGAEVSKPNLKPPFRERGAIALVGLALTLGMVWAAWPRSSPALRDDTSAPTLPSGWSGPLRLTDPAAMSWDAFGSAVSGCGDRLIIGSPGADASQNSQPWDAGAATIFRRTKDGWRVEARLVSPDLTELGRFGCSVALGEGFAVIGATGVHAHGCSSSGAAYLYRYSGGTWTFSQRMTAETPFPKDGFARAVSASESIVAIASWFRVKDVTPDQVPPGAGLATVFRIGDGGATTLQTLTLPDLSFNDFPAASVHVARGGDLILVSAAYAHTQSGESTGKVGVFVRESPGVDRWRLAQVLTHETNESGHFGDWVGSGEPPQQGSPYILVGAPGWRLGESANVGAVLTFTTTGALEGPWELSSVARPPHTVKNGIYGLRFAELGGWRAVFQKAYASLGGPPRPRVFVHETDSAGRALENQERPIALQQESSDDDEFGIGLCMWRAESGVALLAIGQPRGDHVERGAAPLEDPGTVWIWEMPSRSRRGNR